MQIHFHGAARTVTGSQHLLRINGKNILLDCGLYQGKRAESNRRNRNFPFAPPYVDTLILSHAHIDHSGNIPQLVKAGFAGKIICTSPTHDLCISMLQDSGHIQEKDADFFNRKIRKQGEPEIEPLYTQDDAIAALQYFSPIPYEQPHQVTQDVELRFWDAGHMLGSAIVELRLNDHEAKREIRLIFSGDLGRASLPIIRDPSTVEGADVLIMESTYGDETHPPTEDLENELAAIVNRTSKRGGAVIIPAFAVGRTQQLVYSFQKLVAEERIPPIPIFVDSPLATDVTSVFRNHTEVFDAEIRQYMAEYHDDDPFGFSTLHYTRDVEESKELNTRIAPFIVISASGMAETGRILHHLRNRISDHRNTILFVSWQAPDTLGRRILDGNRTVRIFGEENTVHAEVMNLSGLSGHADSDELVAWVAAMRQKPQQTYLVHGELEPATALEYRLRNELKLPQVVIPEMHQVVTV
jgi:metallo-beta-lactamase family protein